MLPPENPSTRFGISRQAQTAVILYGFFILLQSVDINLSIAAGPTLRVDSLENFDYLFFLIFLPVTIAWYRMSKKHSVLIDRDKAVVHQQGASVDIYWRDVGEIHIWQNIRGQLHKIALRKKDFRGISTLSEFENLPAILELALEHAPDAVRVKPHFTLGTAYSPGVAIGVGVIMTITTILVNGLLS